MEDVIKRIPPHSQEAEQSVVAAMILDNKVVDDVFILIEDRDFYHPDLKMIFQAIRKLKQLHRPIDIVTIKDVMGNDDYARVGGNEYITKLAMSISTSVYYQDHCRIIKEKSFQRQVIKYGQELITASYELGLDEVNKQLAAPPMVEFNNTTKHKKTSELLNNTLKDVKKRMTSETTDLRGLPTGIPTLDKATGGMKPGEIIGVKAPPNVGKSVFCVNVCQHLAKQGVETSFFAYEMVDIQFGYRLATSEMRVPIDALVNPKEKLRKNDKYIRRIKDYDPGLVDNIHIFSSNQLPKKTIAEIEGKLRIFPDTKLVVVDYLQLMKHETATGFDAYTENLRDLKALAAKYFVPIMVILGETKDGNIRGTNEIEHDIDQLYEINREKYGATVQEREKAKIFNKKGRDARICKADVRYMEDYIMFVEEDPSGI